MNCVICFLRRSCIFIAMPKNTKISLNRLYHARLYNHAEVRSKDFSPLVLTTNKFYYGQFSEHDMTKSVHNHL